MKELKNAIFVVIVVFSFAFSIYYVFADTTSSLNRVFQNQDKTILVDGNSEASGVASWTTSDGTPSKENGNVDGQGSKVLRVTRTRSSGIDFVYQGVMTIGTTYKLRGWARGDGTHIPVITGSSDVFTGTATTTWQRVDTTFTATSANLSLRIDSGAIGGWAEWDDLSITEVKGNIQNQDKTIVTDGNMEASGTSAWTGNIATISKQTSNPYDGRQVLRGVSNSASNGYVSGSFTLTVGKSYRLRGYVRSDGTAVPQISPNPFAAYLWTGTNTTTWQYFDVVFVSTGTGLRFYITTTGHAGVFAEWDDVSITVYNGNIQNQEKTTLVDGNMEASGTSAWSAYVTTLSKETGSVDGQGSQILRVTYLSSASGGAYRSGTFVPGRSYRIRGWARGDGTSVPRIVGDGEVLWWLGTSSNAWQYFDVIATPASSLIYLYSKNFSATHYVEFDNVSVTLVN